MAILAPDTWASPCGIAYRWSRDGRFEVDGAGFPAWSIPGTHATQIAKIWNDWGAPIQAAADKYGIPTSWLVAIMKIETGGNPTLCSSAGACGLMQFMPFTCRSYGHPDCSYYMSNPADQIPDAADVILKNASAHGGCILSGIKAYNGGSACKDMGMTSGPGILGMYGQNDYVANFVRAANTFAAMGLAPAAAEGSTPASVQAGVVVFVLSTVAFFFADIHWDLSGRVWEAFGGPPARY